MLITVLILVVGLSEFVATKETIYCKMKKSNETTTPILALLRKTCMKKFCMMRTISNRMNIINIVIKGTDLKEEAMIIEQIKCMTR